MILITLLSACFSTSAPPYLVCDIPLELAAQTDTEVTLTGTPMSTVADTLVTIDGTRAQVLEIVRNDCAECDQCQDQNNCRACGRCLACTTACSTCAESVRIQPATIGNGQLELLNKYGSGKIYLDTHDDTSERQTSETGDTDNG